MDADVSHEEVFSTSCEGSASSESDSLLGLTMVGGVGWSMTPSSSVERFDTSGDDREDSEDDFNGMSIEGLESECKGDSGVGALVDVVKG